MSLHTEICPISHFNPPFKLGGISKRDASTVEPNVCCRQCTLLVQLHYLHEVLQDVQEPQELLHAEQPLEQLQEQSAATTRTPAPTNLAFADFIKFCAEFFPMYFTLGFQ